VPEWIGHDITISLGQSLPCGHTEELYQRASADKPASPAEAPQMRPKPLKRQSAKKKPGELNPAALKPYSSQGKRIRTSDLLHPMQALYQTELYPVANKRRDRV
jgi:hypothetical protein